MLSNEATKVHYDRNLKSDPVKRTTSPNFDLEDEYIMQRWSEIRQKMRNDRHRKGYGNGGESFSFDINSDEEPEAKTEEERGSLFEVLQSISLSIFLMQTVGCQLSLIFSSLTAWFDGKLDTGYKMGHLIAWLMGGRAGVLLSLCLSIASWAFGKNSSSEVSVVATAIWIGSNILSYTPLPQGPLLVLLYMSIKLHVDLS